MKILYLLFKTLTYLDRRVRGFILANSIRLMGGKCGSSLQVEKGVVFRHPPHKGVLIGNNVHFGMNTSITVAHNACLIIGSNTSFTCNIFI
jgi:acetyltransferase-like isoleucine patch superfamily enzyme